ncbi:MAG TPA: site-specific integrase [Thermoplasmata archaeon]|jgi:integrase
MVRTGERPGVAEKRDRLSDPDVKRWYANLERGSPVTASNYLRSLSGFARRTGLSLQQVAVLSKKKAHEVLLDFVSEEEKRGMAGSTVQTYIKAVRSWLAYHGKKVDRPIRIRGTEQTPTLRNERVPTQEELRRILLAGSRQQRVAVALMAFAGIRPQVLGNYRGTDGLTVKDFPELVLKGKTAQFKQTPAQVVIRPELSKTGLSYFSFIGTEGCEYVAAYLTERLEAGEKLGPESDILSPIYVRKRFIKTSKISESIRSAIDRSGFDARPYVLRAYFDSQLLIAESKGKLAHDYRVFWMGHKGSIEARYTTNKGRLPVEMIEDMRAAYREWERFISAIPQVAVNRVENLEVVLSELLKAKGVPDEQIQEALAGRLTPEQVHDLVRNTSQADVPEPAVTPGTQRVVNVTEVDAWIEKGWKFVSPLNGSKAVLESRPG